MADYLGLQIAPPTGKSNRCVAARFLLRCAHAYDRIVTNWTVVSPEERSAKRRAIAEGRADVAAGRVISEEKMDAWLESWGTDDELAPPAD